MFLRVSLRLFLFLFFLRFSPGVGEEEGARNFAFFFFAWKNKRYARNGAKKPPLTVLSANVFVPDWNCRIQFDSATSRWRARKKHAAFVYCVLRSRRYATKTRNWTGLPHPKTTTRIAETDIGDDRHVSRTRSNGARGGLITRIRRDRTAEKTSTYTRVLVVFRFAANLAHGCSPDSGVARLPVGDVGCSRR